MNIRKELTDLLKDTGMVENQNRCKIIADELATNGVTIQRWIPVTEQKAPEGELVLCVGAKGGMFLGKMSSWQTATDGSVYCSVPNARGGRSATHWMPLPDAP